MTNRMINNKMSNEMLVLKLISDLKRTDDAKFVEIRNKLFSIYEDNAEMKSFLETAFVIAEEEKKAKKMDLIDMILSLENEQAIDNLYMLTNEYVEYYGLQKEV